MCTLDDGPVGFCGRADDFGDGPPCGPVPGDSGLPPSEGGTATRSSMSFVGQGRGQYIQETTYKYVGDGTGEFDILGSGTGVEERKCDPWQYCLCLHPSFPLCFFPFLLTAGLLSIIIWLLLRPPPSVTFDCDNGRAWMTSWPQSKQDWCCQHGGVCPSSSTARNASAAAADGLVKCEEGLGAGQASWSEETRRYCCENYRLGCEGSLAFNCSKALDTWRTSWSDQKKGWCCQTTGKGCDQGLQQPVVGALFDCQVGRVNWWISWTPEKKAWCCRHETIACRSPPLAQESRSPQQLPGAAASESLPAGTLVPASSETSATASPGPCDEVCVYNGVAASCGSRVRYIAKHEFGAREGSCVEAHDQVVSDCPVCSACEPDESGCREREPEETEAHVPSTEGARYNCGDGVDDTWTLHKKMWCCMHGGHGCVGKAPAQTYDCSLGLATWQKGWSAAKRDWCCSHSHLGCENATVAAASASTTDEFDEYNCNARLATWRDSWTRAKKAWCCQHKRRGCPTSAGGFNCKAGLAAWATKWPLRKREWCCENMGLGCGADPLDGAATVRSVSSAPFDCLASYRNWKQAWSKSKKDWCCRHRRRGCPNDSPEPYNCDNGFSRWEQLWDLGKQSWCCRHHQKGCARPSTSVPFDCLAGYSDWQRLWQQSKKSWCCTHRSRGCPTA